MTAEEIMELLNSDAVNNGIKDKKNIPNLPFVKRNKDHIVFWSVKPSGDYAKDCQTGRKYGALALEHMVKADFRPLFTWCIMDMPRKNDCSGIEVGFLEFFSEIAVYKLAAVF